MPPQYNMLSDYESIYLLILFYSTLNGYICKCVVHSRSIKHQAGDVSNQNDTLPLPWDIA
eukprot:scaffold223663_cov40-Prasinocladus_malaysianus.AAC.1